MKIKNMKILRYLFISSFTLYTFLLLGTVFVQASEKCNFTRDLDLEYQGEDIRCLQKYLNGSGFMIASEGAGSSGKETSLFRELTKQAISKWQKANGLNPASGFFGPLSRKKYEELVSGVLSTPGFPAIPVSTPTISAQEEALRQQLAALIRQAEDQKVQIESSTVTEGVAKESIKKAIKEYHDAEDEIDDNEGGENIDSAKNNLEDSREDLFDAVRAYFSGDYKKAKELADDAFKNAEDAFEDAGGETEEDEIDNLIEKVEDDIDEAEQKIEDADDNDKDVEASEDLLEQAKDKLDEAKDALDDKKYDEAKDLAEKAEGLVDDAIDEIGQKDGDKEDAQDAIDDAKQAIKDAKKKINNADDDGDDIDEAEDLIGDAKNKLDDAREAFDDEDYSDAKKLARKAENLAEEAEDSL